MSFDELFTACNIPVRYQQTSEKDFRSQLEAKMGPVTALDFTEQLMIFEACGMIYDNPEFVQASKVGYDSTDSVSVHLLTCS
jgi:hypothetical protein